MTHPMTWIRSTIALLACILPFSLCFAVYSAEPARRPNIVLILADDLGYGDLGCYGATKIATPHCDRLAREGRRFTDAHSPSAVCSPTRFGLLTGGYPWRENRVPRHLLAGETYVMRDGEPTVASILKSAGYATGCLATLRAQVPLADASGRIAWRGDRFQSAARAGTERRRL